jgi:hypothetical protein
MQKAEVRTNIRWPDVAVRHISKAIHRSTYPQHGLSYNAWCIWKLTRNE